MSPGDLVRVISNPLNAHHPRETRNLVPGDEVTLLKIVGKFAIIAILPDFFRSCAAGGDNTQALNLTDIEMVPEKSYALFTIEEIKHLLKESR